MVLTNTQKTVIIIFTLILGVTIAVIGLFTNSWFLNELPPAPLTGPNTNPDTVAKEITNYKALVVALKESKGFLNELLIVKFIKPLFDSLLVAITAFFFGKELILAIGSRIKK